MNFIGCIGHIMDRSGLSEILVESELYGTSAVAQIFQRIKQWRNVCLQTYDRSTGSITFGNFLWLV